MATLFAISVKGFATYYFNHKNKQVEYMKLQQTYIAEALITLPQIVQKSGEDELMLLILESNKNMGLIDFYELKKNNKTLGYSANFKPNEKLKIPDNLYDFAFVSSGYTYKMFTKQAGPYFILMGYLPKQLNVFTVKSVKQILIDNLIESAILIVVFIFFVFRDFLNQFKLITAGRGQEIKSIKTLTTEGEALKKLFVHSVNISKKQVFAEIPEAVEVELARGTKELAKFNGGMIRIDLNDYTNLCAEYGKEFVGHLLSPVFTEFREHCQRYGFYEVAEAGDERIYSKHHADEDTTTASALAVVRGLFALAQQHSLVIEQNHGFRLSFKASYAFSQMQLVRLDAKFKIDGMAYITSARAIGAFKKRSQKDYCLALVQKPQGTALRLIKGFAQESLHLQGLGDMPVYFITEFNRDCPMPELQPYFLSNADLSIALRRQVGAFEKEWFWELSKILKTFKALVKEPEHQGLLLKLLVRFNQVGFLKASDNAINGLAATMMFVPRLVDAKGLGEPLRLLVKTYLEHDNLRIRANALEVLGEMGVFFIEAKDFIHSENNRIAANAIIIMGRGGDLGPGLIKATLGLLKHNNEFFILSGLYAIEQLSLFYLHRDLTLMKTATFFNEVFLYIKKHLLNLKAQPLVQARAESLYQKFGPYLEEGSGEDIPAAS